MSQGAVRPEAIPGPTFGPCALTFRTAKRALEGLASTPRIVAAPIPLVATVTFLKA